MRPTQYPVEIGNEFETLQEFQKWLDSQAAALEVAIGKGSVKSLIKLSPYNQKFWSEWVRTGNDHNGRRLINIEEETLLLARKGGGIK